MNCPVCKTDLNCPCNNCKERNAGKSLWKWDIDGNIMCPTCGRIISEGEAYNIELQRHKEYWEGKGELDDRLP